MNSSSPRSPEPGWYPDPDVVLGLRYWDGQRWTEHRTPDPGAVSKETRPPRTLGVAILLPIVVLAFYWVILEATWSGCNWTTEPPSVGEYLVTFLFALVPIGFFVYGWRRGQKSLILAAQVALVTVLTAFLLFFVSFAVVADHGCFS
jgi:hypothetical protein